MAKTSTVSKFFKKAKSQAPGPNGLDKSNCGARPTGRLMAQLATQEPTPPLELPEPPGMSGPQSTQALDGLLEVAAKRLHISLQQALLRDAGPFPVAGPATWTDDWHAFRSCPVPHLHEGQDIVAPMGTPLVSAGGYSYLHKNVPILQFAYGDVRQANYYAAPRLTPPPPGWRLVAGFPDYVLFKRDGTCDPAPWFMQEFPR